MFGCCFVIDKNQKSDQCLSGLGANWYWASPSTLNCNETKAVLLLNQKILEVRTESINEKNGEKNETFVCILKTKQLHLLSIWQSLFDQKLRMELYTKAHSTPCMVKRCLHNGVETFVETH